MKKRKNLRWLKKREKNVVLFIKGGRSAKVVQFENPQICGLKNLLYLRTFPKCGTVTDLRCADPIFL
jgi:hypothetical protein